ncbi:hypothetical protein DMENIID0001_109970 [Sergentomyia squamirostris]
MFFVKIVGFLIFSEILCICADVDEIYTWNYVDYKNLPHPEDSYITPEEPYYVKGNTNVEGIGYHAPTGLFIVTVARVKKGVPSTVNAFCADDYEVGSNTPKVWGFPSYEMNEVRPEYFDNAKRRSVRTIKNETEKSESNKELVKEDETETDTKNNDASHQKEVLENDKKIVNLSEDRELSGSKDSLLENDDQDHSKSSYHGNKYHNTHGNSYYKPSKDKNKHQNTHNEYYKPQYSHSNRVKPSSSHNKPYKPHHYDSLSHIHSVHSHVSTHKEPIKVPIPYKESEVSYNKYPATPEESFISVWHPVVDDVCNRVWILDTGVLNYPDGNIIIYPTSIWIIDIPSNKKCGVGPYRVRKRYEVPNTVVPVDGGITYVALDYKKGGTCDDVFAYFPDTFANKINVYDYKNDKSWSFEDHYSFFPVLKTSTYELYGEEFTEEFGVFSITLGWRNAKGYRTAYYIAPTSTVQFGVSTEVLQQENLAPTNYNPDDFRPIGNRGCDNQAVVHVFDSKNGVIFYGNRHDHSIRCWNVRTPPTPDNVDLVFQSLDITYIHEIFIDKHGYLWTLSNSDPFFFKYGFDTDKINVRLFRVHVDDAIAGTVCANDDDEYKAIDLYDYPKALNDLFSSIGRNATKTNK